MLTELLQFSTDKRNSDPFGGKNTPKGSFSFVLFSALENLKGKNKDLTYQVFDFQGGYSILIETQNRVKVCFDSVIADKIKEGYSVNKIKGLIKYFIPEIEIDTELSKSELSFIKKYLKIYPKK